MKNSCSVMYFVRYITELYSEIFHNPIMTFNLPKLKYSFDDLEPYIDKETMEIHYLKYHQGYIDKLNLIVGKEASLESVTAEYMLTHLDNINAEIRPSIVNFAGGHVNHSFFWKIMTPEQTSPGELTNKVISDKWDSTELFLEEFAKRALSIFGSGWAWLVALNNQPGIDITTTSNQDSPISVGATPKMGIDVWEHAYYLKYQNRRVDYIKAWMNVINWNTVEKNILRAERGPP